LCRILRDIAFKKICIATCGMISNRRETALQGALWISPKVEDWNRETIFHGHYRSSFNHYHIIGLKICRIRWKKRKIRAIPAFKVIQGIEVGTNGKPVCDFLLVINSNWHPISYRFGVIAAYCSNFRHCAFLSHPLGAYQRISWTHWKARSGLPISINLSFFARCYGRVATSEEIENRRFCSNAVTLIQNFR